MLALTPGTGIRREETHSTSGGIKLSRVPIGGNATLDSGGRQWTVDGDAINYGGFRKETCPHVAPSGASPET